MVTEQNLRAAFTGERQANRKYLAFAKRAERQGLVQVAKLFRATAAAETVHATAHLRVMAVVHSTRENLEEALASERYAFREMYPDFVTTAMDEGAKAAMLTSSNAMEVEKVHHRLYGEALKHVASGEDMPEERIFVCSVCGNTIMGEPPERCPVCNAPREKFDEVE
jgi:rubrerythrin